MIKSGKGSTSPSYGKRSVYASYHINMTNGRTLAPVAIYEKTYFFVICKEKILLIQEEKKNTLFS
jgi:hypothetical protein